MQNPKSGPVTLIACLRDRLVISDPAVRYRPRAISGRHYLVIPAAPQPQPEPTE
jgi:hypothetical protein